MQQGVLAGQGVAAIKQAHMLHQTEGLGAHAAKRIRVHSLGACGYVILPLVRLC